MRLRRLDERGSAGTALLMPLTAAGLLAAMGCAHHRADQYAYAPPYAPPVYPQPQVHIPAQPAAYAGVAPVGTAPVATMMASPTTVPAGTVVPAVGGDCPPCSTPGVEGVVMPATMVEGSGQTPPCPPGP